MKKRWYCFVIALTFACTCVAPMQADAANAGNTDWITAKMNEYIAAVSKVPTPHWNLGRNNGGDERSLKAAADTQNYTYGLTSMCCVGSGGLNGTHDYNASVSGKHGCESNVFGAAAQCMGFVKYFSYVLYGSCPTLEAPSSKVGMKQEGCFTYYARGASYPGLQAGDVIRYNYKGGAHSAVVYRVTNGTIYVIDCNRTSDPCVVNLNKALPYVSETGFKSLYAGGSGYIIRYNGDPPMPSVNIVTNPTVNVTSSSAQITGSLNASADVTLEEFGILLGPTAISMVRTNTIKNNLATSSKSISIDTADLGIHLEPDTTYYYNVYAKIGTRAYVGEFRTFKTAASPQMPSQPTPTPHVSILLSQSSMTIQDNVCKNLSATTTPANLAVTWKSSNPSVATVNNGSVTGLKAGTTTVTASISYNGQTASASCVVTVEAKKPCSHVKGKYLWYAAVHPHYDHYICAVCGEQFRDTATNYMPSCEICKLVKFSNLKASNITASSVKLDSSCAYTGSRPTSVGVFLGTSPSNMQIKGADGNINHNKNPFDIWYNLSGLSAGTTYYYRFYAVVDGNVIYSDIKSFTTSVR